MVILESKFSLLKKLINKDISIKELEDLLFNMGLELDDLSDDDIKIDITSDRPDLVSTHGLARAIKSYLGKKRHELKVFDNSDYKVIIDKSVEKIRPYTFCVVVKDINLDDEKIKEIIWVQEKLHATFGRNRKKAAIGIYPLDKIFFPVNFRADDPKKINFIPLGEVHSMSGLEILQKTETGRKYSFLLENFKKYPYFIDSKNDILSLPPIINSQKTGRVTESTKDLFIECSGFDFNALKYTLNILANLFSDFGGKLYSVELNYPLDYVSYFEKYPNQKISYKKLKDHLVIKSPVLDKEVRTIKLDFIKKMSGLDLTSKEVSSLLTKMMYDVLETKKDSIKFSVPEFRVDIWHDVDVVDDILRAYGINNISPEIPELYSESKPLFINKLKNKVSELMIGLEFQEIFTLILTDKLDQFEKMNLSVEDNIDKFIELGHTAEESINMIRLSLLPEALKFLVNNRNRSLPQKIFEINEVVEKDLNSDVKSRTKMYMTSLICDHDSNFTKIKQVLVYLLESLKLEYSFKKSKHDSYIEGRVAEVYIKNKDSEIYLGLIGELHPKVLYNFDLIYPVSSFEIDFNVLKDGYLNSLKN